MDQWYVAATKTYYTRVQVTLVFRKIHTYKIIDECGGYTYKSFWVDEYVEETRIEDVKTKRKKLRLIDLIGILLRIIIAIFSLGMIVFGGFGGEPSNPVSDPEDDPSDDEEFEDEIDYGDVTYPEDPGDIPVDEGEDPKGPGETGSGTEDEPLADPFPPRPGDAGEVLLKRRRVTWDESIKFEGYDPVTQTATGVYYVAKNVDPVYLYHRYVMRPYAIDIYDLQEGPPGTSYIKPILYEQLRSSPIILGANGYDLPSAIIIHYTVVTVEYY